MLLEFHRELLADTLRTDAYRSAIRSVVSHDSVVLDLGTGTGILAFFACEAGARRVFAIEETDAGVVSMLARHVGLSDRVEIIHARSTEVELPERADVLVTEILGSLGLDEHILSSVIDARARLLVPDAAIIPRHLALCLAPVETASLYAQQIAWWDEKRYGFDLGPMRTLASNRLCLADADPSGFLAPPATVIDVDLAAAASSIVSGTSRFDVTRSGALHGFVGWFIATLIPGVTLSNDTAGRTHWDQLFLPLEHPVNVHAGDAVNLGLKSYDGDVWEWGGAVESNGQITTFSQSTVFGAPPNAARSTT
jgi:protein arginine N-methyltransferase 1